MKDYLFKVEKLQAGQQRKYADSIYFYRITTSLPERMVKEFCMNVLKKSVRKEDMKTPFDGELLSFSKVTENKKFPLDNHEETYEYKCRYAYTG